MTNLDNFTDDERLIFLLTLQTEHLALMLYKATGTSFDNIANMLSIRTGVHASRMNDQEARELIQKKRTEDRKVYHAVMQSIKDINN